MAARFPEYRKNQYHWHVYVNGVCFAHAKDEGPARNTAKRFEAIPGNVVTVEKPTRKLGDQYKYLPPLGNRKFDAIELDGEFQIDYKHFDPDGIEKFRPVED